MAWGVPLGECHYRVASWALPDGGFKLAVEMAIWRMTEAGPRPLKLLPLDFEQRLEDMLAEDPSMSGIDLLSLEGRYRTGRACTSAEGTV